MGDNVISIRCKQTLLSKIGFPVITFLGKYRLISLSTSVELGNFVLNHGAVKTKVDGGKWETLKGLGDLKVEDYA